MRADTDRGQTFTLEAVVAAILLLAAVGFALHVVAVSANTASPGDAETRGQHVGLVSGVLDEAAADGSLKETVLYWNPHLEQFHDASDTDGFYVSEPPPTDFGAALGSIFEDRPVRFNVDLYYYTDDGKWAHHPLVESGTPSTDGVRLKQHVTLYEHTALTPQNGEGNEQLTLGSVNEEGNVAFYAPDVYEDGSLYNVIRVEVVVW